MVINEPSLAQTKHGENALLEPVYCIRSFLTHFLLRALYSIALMSFRINPWGAMKALIVQS